MSNPPDPDAKELLRSPDGDTSEDRRFSPGRGRSQDLLRSPGTLADYMLAADGELDAATLTALAARPGFAETDLAATVAGVTELGHLVRGHLELSADEAEPRLADLWDLVERRLDRERDESPAPADPVGANASWFSRTRTWLSGYRSHLATGLVSAGAVAALALALRPDPVDRVVVKTVTVPSIPPAVLTATPPEVESLELVGGSGTMFTVAGDGDEGETAVIWIEPDDPADATEGI